MKKKSREAVSEMTESTKASIARYKKEKREQVRLDVPKGTLAKYKAFAERNGMSMTAFITALVEAEIAKDAEFTAEWAEKVEAEQSAMEQDRQAEIDRIKAEMKPPERR